MCKVPIQTAQERVRGDNQFGIALQCGYETVRLTFSFLLTEVKKIISPRRDYGRKKKSEQAVPGCKVKYGLNAKA